MAKSNAFVSKLNFLRQMIRVHNSRPIFVINRRFLHDQQQTDESRIEKRMVQEVRIPVPYGEIAGKWWGPKHLRPIVSLHGWQDNAGTFDRLIPLLPHHMSFLALDFPGHGLSSRIPDGLTYNTLDSVYLLMIIMKHYEWNKISLMAHSMGSIVSFIFSATFPEIVDFNIGIDALKPHISDPVKIGPRLQKRIPQMMIADSRNREQTEPPCYCYKDLVNRLYIGTNKSVTKEVASYLLNRNIQKSNIHPDKYYFSRDSRLKYNLNVNWGQDVNLELAKRMTMPYLFMKALKSSYYEDKKYFDEFVEVVKKNNPLFELEFVDSTHHMHLTEPEKLAPSISKFLLKHWKEDMNSN